ncbi:MAG TPA: hypothetical protein VMS64_19455 [Candidatus Methylomirabilis sp.]|nr:hypothetical protein [Candidatus Methylomirabilis sp.]
MAIVAMVLVSIVFIGPLVWRIWQDRRQDEGDVIAADIRAAINRRLRGESLVAVRVTPRAPWRSGRIVLSVPSGYESLVETAWPGVARRLPSGYELVLAATEHGGARSARGAEARTLPRAA